MQNIPVAKQLKKQIYTVFSVKNYRSFIVEVVEVTITTFRVVDQRSIPG